jgi:hypothetical protein
MLCIIYEFTRESLMILMARKLRATDVIEALCELFVSRVGRPKEEHSIRYTKKLLECDGHRSNHVYTRPLLDPFLSSQIFLGFRILLQGPISTIGSFQTGRHRS